MKKIIAYLLCFLLYILQIQAGPKYLIITMKNQEKVVYPINESVKIHFNDGKISLATDMYLFENIVKYTLQDNLTSINGLKNVTNVITYINDQTLFIDSPYDTKEILLYGIDGISHKLKYKDKIGSTLIFELPNLSKGVYLLKIKNEVLKIAIR